MIIKKASQNEIDVFWSIGWSNWARFRIGANRYLTQVAGIDVPKPVMHDLINRYNRKGVK